MICIALAEKTIDTCLEIVKQVELAEIRLDMVNYSLEDVKRLFSSGSKLVATCRPGKYTEDIQLMYLKAAVESGAAYLDIEYEAAESYKNELIKHARSHSCDVIISYHNYESTPGIIKLQKIVEDIYAMGADVAKVATMVNQTEDVAKILSLYSNGNRLVAVGMGERGKITRLLAPILGAEFTFATLEGGKETAPGQLTRDKLLEVLEMLKKL